MKKFILTAGVVFIFIVSVLGQNEEDALRYSTVGVIGSARYMGLGGAFGALGADFSTLSSNPAGIGLYKKSEFSISPSIFFSNTQSTYNGVTLDDGKNNFALGNAGLIISQKPTDRLDRNPLDNWQIGFGINRLKDFNNRVKIEGMNGENSILDTYVEYATGKNPQILNSFDTRLAFDTYLIDTVPGTDPDFQYIDAYDYIGGFTGTLQRKSIETSGSMNEWVLAGGINISDRFYVGLSLGFPYIRYKQNSTYTEINQNPEKDIDKFNVYENMETKGSGFNLKAGVILRLLPFLRIGAAFHTPTWYHKMTDKWSSRMDAYYANGDYFESRSPNGSYDYEMQTPWKAIGSAAFVLGRLGLISADVEYVNYSNARLSAGDYGFYDENRAIESSFTEAINARLGAEINLGVMQLRGGYGYYMSPFASEINDGVRQVISGGLGYRGKSVYTDLAFSYNLTNLDYYLYGTENISVNPVDNQYTGYTFIFTLGYRFE
jgi:hypothetical protein